jgi:divalent metal cation (Fe/Co/Zn/Cd) transporter
MPIWWSEPSGHNAYVLSWVSLIVTLTAAIGGIVAYYKLDSSLILVYGLENCVDFFSSAIVLWRFFLPPSADAAEEARLLSRERRASVGISIVLALLGFVVIVTAMEDFSVGQEAVDRLYRKEVYYISFASILVFGAMTLFKFQYAKKLNSSSLRKDGICSALGTILAISLFFNSTVMAMASNGNMWWLDPLVALTCGIGSLVYGLVGVYKAYVKDGLPIYSCSWWMYGSGDEDNEVLTNNQGGSTSPYGGASLGRGDDGVEMREEII